MANDYQNLGGGLRARVPRRRSPQDLLRTVQLKRAQSQAMALPRAAVPGKDYIQLGGVRIPPPAIPGQDFLQIGGVRVAPPDQNVIQIGGQPVGIGLGQRMREEEEAPAGGVQGAK
jgi:hypothetical protein